MGLKRPSRTCARNGAHHAQKNELKPWLKDDWCIPETASAEFVCAMEDALAVYHRAQDDKRPQCLNARIPDQQTLTQQVSAWQNRRNASASTVNWRFTTADARIKLECLYPSIEDC